MVEIFPGRRACTCGHVFNYKKSDAEFAANPITCSSQFKKLKSVRALPSVCGCGPDREPVCNHDGTPNECKVRGRGVRCGLCFGGVMCACACV
jgi:hypothetical protein